MNAMAQRASTSCLAIAAMLVLTSCSPPPKPVPPKPEPLHTTVCELSRHPGKYYGKLVQIRARVKVGFESSNLYDIRCVESAIEFSGYYDNPKIADLKRATEPSSVRSVVNATLLGSLGRPTEFSDSKPIFRIQSASDIKTKSGPSCPWVIPPLPPARGPDESELSYKAKLDRIWHDDPCAPDNWLRAHPGQFE